MVANSVDVRSVVEADSYVSGAPLCTLKSLCVLCRENILFPAFSCPHCGERNNEVQSAGEIQPRGCHYSLLVPLGDKKMLNRRVFISETATIKIPELDFEIPPKAQHGSLSTVSGILVRAANELEILQEERKEVDPLTAEAIDKKMIKLKACASGDSQFTFTLDDPTGNSFTENLCSPSPDPSLTTKFYERTREQIAALGFLADTAVPPPLETGFSFTLTRVAVAQICQSMGFRGSQNGALKILTDIATIYLKSIAKFAVTSANAHGRTESNLLDIIVALEDLSSIQGFAGASNLRSRSLYASGAVKDLMKFVKYTDEIPFAQALPMSDNFFLGAKQKSLKRSRWYRDGGNLNHVPRWLTDFPVVMEVQEKRSERKEKIWGCLDGGGEDREEGNGSEVVALEKKGKYREMALLGKREKVRFKIGVAIGKLRGVGDGGNGVCRGGGIGKRIIVYKRRSNRIRKENQTEYTHSKEGEMC